MHCSIELARVNFHSLFFQDEYVDPNWYCYDCRRVEKSKPPTSKTENRPIVAVWGTAVAEKKNLQQNHG
jgi:hypothetical protein